MITTCCTAMTIRTNQGVKTIWELYAHKFCNARQLQIVKWMIVEDVRNPIDAIVFCINIYCRSGLSLCSDIALINIQAYQHLINFTELLFQNKGLPRKMQFVEYDDTISSARFFHHLYSFKEVYQN